MERFEDWMPFAKARAAALVKQEQVEDAIQEAYIGLLNAICTYNNEMGIQFNTYASVCIKNAVLNFVAREQKQTDNLVYSSSVGQWIPINNSVEADMIQKEDKAEIIDACGELNEREKDVLFSRLLADSPETHRDIADRWGVAHTSIQRDEVRLKDLIKENYSNGNGDNDNLHKMRRTS